MASIIAVTTYSAILTSEISPLNQNTKYFHKARPPPESGTWGGFLFKVLLCVGVCVIGWFGYQKYYGRQTRSSGLFGGNNLGRGSGFGPGYYGNGKKF